MADEGEVSMKAEDEPTVDEASVEPQAIPNEEDKETKENDGTGGPEEGGEAGEGAAEKGENQEGKTEQNQETAEGAKGKGKKAKAGKGKGKDKKTVEQSEYNLGTTAAEGENDAEGNTDGGAAKTEAAEPKPTEEPKPVEGKKGKKGKETKKRKSGSKVVKSDSDFDLKGPGEGEEDGGKKGKGKGKKGKDKKQGQTEPEIEDKYDDFGDDLQVKKRPSEDQMFEGEGGEEHSEEDHDLFEEMDHDDVYETQDHTTQDVSSHVIERKSSVTIADIPSVESIFDTQSDEDETLQKTHSLTSLYSDERGLMSMEEREKLYKVEKWVPPPPGQEKNPNYLLDVDAQWQRLFGLPTCQQVMLKPFVQERIGLVVGVNVSQEFPWKQKAYHQLRDRVFNFIDNGDKYILAFQKYHAEAPVLIGFAPLLTQNKDDIDPEEGDPFIFFINSDDTKTALMIIRNIEKYEAWKIKARIEKLPRKWYSLGSEREVNLTLQRRVSAPVEVEIQSIYPLNIPSEKGFSMRLSADVRDGYVQLVPTEYAKFDNITKKCVSIGIQSAAATRTVEQQTDPTFPTNAWAQYLYEIMEGDEGLDESEEDEAAKEEAREKRKSSIKPGQPLPAIEEPPKPPPELSERMQFLLSTLEFNQIDLYRNDYPLITNKHVEHYATPYLDELLCFANISKSHQRFVSGVDWYQRLAGLIVISYTFSTPATIEKATRNIDTVQRTVLQPNPILMWSFSDNLNYKLEFESALEVTALSFCPHNKNLLFGGSFNGQVTLWDLQGRTEKLDVEEILTAAQSGYRSIMSEFLDWTIETKEESVVPPATISSLESSPKAAITAFYWCGKRIYINTFGKVYTDPDKNANHKYFIATAFDGSVSFWNMDSMDDKKSAAAVRHDMPRVLSQSESAYTGKLLKPFFSLQFNEPITAMIADTTVFRCNVPPIQPGYHLKKQVNFPIELVRDDNETMRQSAVIATFYGHIESITWSGLFADAEGKELIHSSIPFARVHDGPIVAMKKNPFIKSLFASIGRNVFAVWKDDYNYSPILWRRRICDLTAVAWSEVRPSVLFLTRIDGNIEAWDILTRDDDACFDDILGGGIITAIAEHKPSVPEKLLGIGDYNSSFRMVRLPPSFTHAMPNELERFTSYIENTVERKKNIQLWEEKYFEANRDVIEAKREAETYARQEMERIEKENALNAARKAKEAAEHLQAQQTSLENLTYTERMAILWDQLNLRRMLAILMSRKQVNEEQLKRDTALEKEYLAYEAAKKDSLAEVLRRVPDELAEVRARILPVEKLDMTRQDRIIADMQEVLAKAETYANIETESNETIASIETFDTIDYIDFVKRGEQRRKILDKSLGGNTERLYWYQNMLQDLLLGECVFSYERFYHTGRFNEGSEEGLDDIDMDVRSSNFSGSIYGTQSSDVYKTMGTDLV